MLPDDWRQQMVGMISGRDPLDGTLFLGGPTLDPQQQIGVYARQYRIRMYEALEEEVVGLKSLLGTELKSVLWAYLHACPSTSWTLERIAVRLEGWLRDQGAPVEQIEMAAVDRAVQAGFIAADGQPLQLEQLTSLPTLELQPPVQLLRLTTNVHDVRSALRSGTTVDLQHGLDVHLVVFRNGRSLQHLELKPGAWHLLDGLRHGLSVPDALERLVLDGILEPDAIATSVQAWFRDFATHQLVQVVEVS